MFWLFGHKGCGILAPWLGVEPALPALGGKILTTGPPGRAPVHHFVIVKKDWEQRGFLLWRFCFVTQEGKIPNSSLQDFPLHFIGPN